MNLGWIFAALAFSAPSSLTPPATPQEWAEFSSAVALDVVRRGVTYSCSGVLVNRVQIFTAAHCIVGADAVHVSLDSDPDSGSWHSTDPARTRVHPGYTQERSFFMNDLALIELREPIEGIRVHPILMNCGSLVRKTRFERIGFGLRSGNRLRNWTNPALLASAAKGAVGNVMVLDDSMALPGDSGGPIFSRDTQGGLILVGIHSTLHRPNRAFEVGLCGRLKRRAGDELYEWR